MKKLLVIAIALFTLNGMAQQRERSKDRHGRLELRKDLTPQDIADLKSKKLTLKLDLTEKQQKEVHKIILSQSEKNLALRNERKSKEGEKREKPSNEEFVKMQNYKLDQQIEMKRKMKNILTAEQYAIFETIKPREHKRKGKRRKRA